MKKCKQCGAPLEGFFYNTIGKLLGIAPSTNDPEACNKCAPTKENDSKEPGESETQKLVETPASSEMSADTPTEPVSPMAEEPTETSDFPEESAEDEPMMP